MRKTESVISKLEGVASILMRMGECQQIIKGDAAAYILMGQTLYECAEMLKQDICSDESK